ncbi:MAG: hypothetical protein ACLPIX_10950, partial [Rhodomicrobium sp.]
NVSIARGDLDAAEAAHKKALALYEQLGSKEGMAANNGNLGVVSKARGDLDAACLSWKKAKNLYQEMGIKPNIEMIESGMRESGCA